MFPKIKNVLKLILFLRLFRKFRVLMEVQEVEDSAIIEKKMHRGKLKKN